MSYRVLPPEIHRRLLILDPPPSPRRVSFSDLNEVRSFSYKDPPVLVSGKAEVELLRAHIRRLERKINRLEHQHTMIKPINVTMLPPSPPDTPRTPGTERSVYSPAANTDTYYTALTETPPPPMNVQRALYATPTQTFQPPRLECPSLRRQPDIPPKPSMLKRFLSGAGALCFLGILPSIVTIVALGPFGLAVAGGCFVLGCLFMAAAGKVN